MKSILSSLAFVCTFVFAIVFATAWAAPAATGPENPIVIDVRTSEEFAESHLKGAINIDVLKPDFQSEVSKLDKSKTVKVYCRSGGRAGKALGIMNSVGFKDVENLGSLNQASKKMKRECDGKGPC